VGHVFIRLSGFGMRLIPFWPYEFARTGAAPDSVEVVHMTEGGRAAATVDRGRRSSVAGVVDVLDGPDHEHWRLETSVYGFEWPEGFEVGSAIDVEDRKPYYLYGPDDAAIFPQGPLPTERVPDAAGLTAPDQTVARQYRLDDIDVVELTYDHDGGPWWQTHWAFPIGAGKSLVITGQSPAKHRDLMLGAIDRMVSTLGPV
jgi:hypothetical protein